MIQDFSSPGALALPDDAIVVETDGHSVGQALDRVLSVIARSPQG